MKVAVVIFWTLAFALTLVWDARGYAPREFNNDNRVSVDDVPTGVQGRLSGPEPRIVDNGDGTVSDQRTGLMWETKTVDDSVHSLRKIFTWSDSGSRPDGTAFTEFLPALNDCTGDEHQPVQGGFAGHCDWRLPTADELLAILGPVTPEGCLDPIFGAPSCGSFWASNDGTLERSRAWTVDFDGFAETLEKVTTQQVRAVRSDRRAPSGTR